MGLSNARSWSSIALSDSSSAWFVTEWNGKYAGAPAARLMFVISIPRSKCLTIRLFQDAAPNWQYNELIRLAATVSPPDHLITDDVCLESVIVAAGSAFKAPASAFLDKTIALMPAVRTCLKSLEAVLNSSILQSVPVISVLNNVLESWRLEYNTADNKLV